MAATFSPNSDDLVADDYIVLGLATCFVKEDGEVYEVHVLEPIPSAAMEAIAKGIPTSYKMARAMTLGSVLNGDTPKMPEGFPPDTQFCDEFALRAISTARTYKRRQVAQSLIPLGTARDDFKYSVERKRVLNAARLVTQEDNIKQHSHTHKVL